MKTESHLATALRPHTSKIDALYAASVKSRRSGPLYNAFSYPTKIDPELIALFIASHTRPGDAVLDVFAGSGTTGLAVRLCDQPTDLMKARAAELGLSVEWGPRSAVLYEISVIGSLLAETMCNPPDPNDFARAAREMVADVTARLGWLYEAKGPDGSPGSIRHTLWSESVICGTCQVSAPFWDLAVSREPLAIRKTAICRSCGSAIPISSAERDIESVVDPVTGDQINQRVRRPACVYGRSGKRVWQRPPIPADYGLIKRVLDVQVPACVPSSPIRWGDLHRSGYHQGISRIHHFYTRRNLIALGALWEEVDRKPSHLRESLRLLILSYNAAHSTLMTRVVVKNGLTDFALTGAQTGVLYVSSLPVEKNVFSGVGRKISTFTSAFAAARHSKSQVRVVNATSTQLDLPDRSIDYVFTDPPFGGFIPYAEINQINEAWLGQYTDVTDEAIISAAQGKGASEYGVLLQTVFVETSRAMKDQASATVVFHSSKPEVWRALDQAFTSSGLSVKQTNMLDKLQGSFKQVVSDGSTRGDAIFLLSKGKNSTAPSPEMTVPATILKLRSQYGSGLTPQHLYSRYVAGCLRDGKPVEATSRDFYRILSANEVTAS